MYNFIDVTQASAGMVLPSEALQINGSYIEDQISGYRTLSVQGREYLSPELETFETGVRDGSTLKSKRYPSRTITVKYQLIAKSNEEFREAYNKLGLILDVEDAQLIFNDEQDKYFTGTPCGIEPVEPGKNAVVGSFDILCIDPFKYSVYETEVLIDPEEKATTFEYTGTYKAHPKLEAEFYKPEAEIFTSEEDPTTGELTPTVESPPGDCGYVAFFNEDEKIIQLGDPTEADGGNTLALSQGLINQPFYTEDSWSTTSKNLWTVNKGHIMATNVTQVGSVYMGEASPEKVTTTTYSSSTKQIGGYVAKYTTGASVFFKIYAGVSNRTARSATINFYVTVSLSGSTQLSADTTAGVVIYCQGNPLVVSLRTKSDSTWRSGTSYSASKSYIVSGLTSSATKIDRITFNASIKGNNVANAVACNAVEIQHSDTISVIEATHFLTPNAYGTVDSGWHGPSIRRKVGKDASGFEGARDFTLTYRQKLCIGTSSAAKKQVGSFRMNVTDSDGKNIVGIWVYKNKTGKAGKMVFYVNGVEENITDIDLHHGNDFFGGKEDAVCTTTITKVGGAIEFAVGSYKRSFFSEALRTVLAWHVTFSFEKYAELTPLAYNGLYWVKFVKNNCNTYKDIPNKFSANDVLVADCNTAEITLNGIPTPNLGAVGNDWEGFVLKPGLNHIGVAYSEWVEDEYAPALRVKYREVFL